jgi:hypothetical protein
MEPEADEIELLVPEIIDDQSVNSTIMIFYPHNNKGDPANSYCVHCHQQQYQMVVLTCMCNIANNRKLHHLSRPSVLSLTIHPLYVLYH